MDTDVPIEDIDALVADVTATPVTSPRMPLTASQRQFWVFEQLAARSSVPWVNHVGAQFTLSGPLDLRALTEAVATVVRRHDALSVTFAQLGEEPAQTLGAAAAPTLAVADLEGHDALEQTRLVQKAVRDELVRPFDLGRSSGIRFALQRLAPDRHVLIVTAHHLIIDGVSSGVVVSDLLAQYAALAANGPPLPEPTARWADFVRFELALLERPTIMAPLRAYWERCLADAVPAELPADHPAPPVPSLRGSAHEAILSQETLAALTTVSRRYRSSLFVTLLATLKLLLFQRSGRADTTLGVVYGLRTVPEFESLVGCMINTLLVRTCVGEGGTFAELVAHVGAALHDAAAHGDLPYEHALRAAHRNENAAFARVVVDYQPKLATREVARLRVRGDSAFAPGIARNDILVLFTPVDEQLVVAVEYSTDRFDARTIQTFLDDLVTLLTRIAREPETRVAALLASCRGAPKASSPAATREAPREPAPAAAPTGPSAALPALEADVAAIVADVFEVKTIRRDDNFFRYGANSLRLAELIARLNDTFDANLSPEDLWSASTLGALATLVAGRREEAGASRASQSPLVRLNATERGVPLYCVHSVTGDTNSLSLLGQCFEGVRPFIGVRAPGFLGEAPPLTDVRSLAACYVASLPPQQPGQPYLLAGHSLGGAIAFEMARLLTDRGDRVGLVAMIDTFTPALGAMLSPAERNEFEALLMQQLLRQLGATTSVDATVGAMRRAQSREQKLAAVFDWLVEAGQMRKGAWPAWADVLLANHAAFESYTPEFAPIDVTVLAADEVPCAPLKTPGLGWNDLARSVESIRLPGNHSTIVTERQNAEGVAAALERRIAQIEIVTL